MPPDYFGDVADRHALVGDRVQRRSCRGVLQRQAEEVRGIEAVHGGPAVGPVADEAGDALVAGDADNGRHEAVISVAVIRRGESHDRRADAARSEGEHQLGSGLPGLRTAAHSRHRRGGTMPVPFGRYPPWCGPERPGGDDERPARSGQRVSEGLDGAAVRIGGSLEVAREGELVLELDVDHPIRRGSCTAQAAEVIKSAAMDLRAGRGESSGRGIRAGEPGDLMARADELGYDGGADPAGRAGDENTHEKTSR